MNHQISYDKARNEPDVILEHMVPFIKIKSFFAWQPPENAFLINMIPKYSRYPIAVIHEHLGRHFSPETSIRVISHSLDEKRRTRKTHDKQRFGLHIHAYYVDILHEIFSRISRNVRLPLDIFLTTVSEDKAEAIRQLLKQDFPKLHIRQLLVCENLGRDIWPWLQVAPLLECYDIAGHLHTKKSPTVAARFGMVWREELLDCLLGRFGQIQNAFFHDPTLGIVIPDVPSLYRFPPYPYLYDTDTNMKNLLPEVWKRLGCHRPLDFSMLRMLVFPYGNMFWYRPKALEPLWHTNWESSDFPAEPLPPHGTLLHALERLPVYVAWERGYDFRIVRPTAVPPSGFQSDFALCEYRRLNEPAPTMAPDRKATIMMGLRTQVRKRLCDK